MVSVRAGSAPGERRSQTKWISADRRWTLGNPVPMHPPYVEKAATNSLRLLTLHLQRVLEKSLLLGTHHRLESGVRVELS